MTDTLLRVVLDAHASPGPERDASGRRVLDIGHLERRRNSSHAELAVVLLLMRNGQSLSLGRGQIATEEYSRAFISGKWPEGKFYLRDSKKTDDRVLSMVWWPLEKIQRRSSHLFLKFLEEFFTVFFQYD